MFLTRFAAAIIVTMTCTAVAATDARPQPRTITCTNPFSGTTWQISVDLDRATVDSYPARLSEDGISWHDDKDGGTYTLDRKTGELTFVAASSTGGYFLHDHCRLPQ